jgi:Zn-dependent protease
MQKYTLVNFMRIYGAPVYLHWSALLVVALIIVQSVNNPILAIISAASYFGIILVHETGHAFFVRRLGYQVHGIYLGFIHGLCEYELPYNMKHQAIIAWGGVIAQLVIAIPLIIAAQVFEINNIPGLGPVVAFMGYISVMVAIVNLAPGHPFDGATAWKLIPILIKERTKVKSKTKKHKFK